MRSPTFICWCIWAGEWLLGKSCREQDKPFTLRQTQARAAQMKKERRWGWPSGTGIVFTRSASAASGWQVQIDHHRTSLVSYLWFRLKVLPMSKPSSQETLDVGLCCLSSIFLVSYLDELNKLLLRFPGIKSLNSGLFHNFQSEENKAKWTDSEMVGYILDSIIHTDLSDEGTFDRRPEERT